YLEKSKAKVLLNQLAAKRSDTKGWGEELGAEGSKILAEIQKALPGDLVIVEYFTTSAETLVFLVSARAFYCVPLPIGREALAQLVSRFLDFVRSGRGAEAERTARGLYKALIAPIKSYLGEPRTLCIVPDDRLFYIPFPALITDEG